MLLKSTKWILVHHGSRLCGSGVRGSPRGGRCWCFDHVCLFAEDQAFITPSPLVSGLEERYVRGDMDGQAILVFFPRRPM